MEPRHDPDRLAHDLAAARQRLAQLLERASHELETSAALAEAHAERRSPHVDEATLALEHERARRAREYADRARANAEHLRRPRPA